MLIVKGLNTTVTDINKRQNVQNLIRIDYTVTVQRLNVNICSVYTKTKSKSVYLGEGCSIPTTTTISLVISLFSLQFFTSFFRTRSQEVGGGATIV